MELIKAFTLSLGELNLPIITPYRMGLIMHALYKQKAFHGDKLSRIQKPFAEQADLTNAISKLVDDGVLNHVSGLAPHVYTLLGNTQNSAEDIACTLDPFAYVSHLSAMAYHGLTDRIPSKLFISSPNPAQWKQFAQERMQSDLGKDFEAYCSQGLPQLTRIEFKKIHRTEIQRFSSIHWGAYKNVHDRQMRVATIGRTFLDMLKNPELCGGINHVLDVYNKNAKKYLRLITDEVEQHGTAIDKVRAGYILEEKLGLQSNAFAAWVEFAQRGGSRKLDATAEYQPRFSEKWCLSLNVVEK